jgi:hypothetical protein
MLSTLGPKKVTKIGIWNVRTLHKTKEDLEEVSYGRGTERRKDVVGGGDVGSGQKSLEKLRGSPLLLHRRQQEIMMIHSQVVVFSFMILGSPAGGYCFGGT